VEPVLSKEQITAQFREAGANVFAAVVHLGFYDIVGETTERQALDGLALWSASGRSGPMPVKIGEYQGRLQPTPLWLLKGGVPEKNMGGLAARLMRIEASPLTEPISQSAEAIIVQVEKQGAPSNVPAILRKAFAKLAAIRDAGFRS
jgi:hypothetical protein